MVLILYNFQELESTLYCFHQCRSKRKCLDFLELILLVKTGCLNYCTFHLKFYILRKSIGIIKEKKILLSSDSSYFYFSFFWICKICSFLKKFFFFCFYKQLRIYREIC